MCYTAQQILSDLETFLGFFDLVERFWVIEPYQIFCVYGVLA